MSSIYDRRTIAASLIAAFVLMAVSPALPVYAEDVPSDINIGPYVDKVVFKIIEEPGQQLLSLLSGEIDLCAEYVNPAVLPILEADPDISIYSALRNGYGHITINCNKYPLNISGFRRAFAYAFDKTRVRMEAHDGFSQEHDSLIPYVNDWCIEDQLPYHYYSSEPEIGNQILDNLDFDIDPVSGFRNAPDGSPFDVTIEYGSNSEEVAGTTARIGVDALRSLHVNADTRPSDLIEFLSRLDSHGDYDMIMYATNFLSNNVVWLTDYLSKYVDSPYHNPSNFHNNTYDLECSRFISSMTFAEAYDAAATMQLILHENVPELVVYENFYTQGYRNDVFTGHVADLGRYIAGPWTLRKIHKIDGTPGGSVSIAYESVLSFNLFQSGRSIMQKLVWPSLYSIGPDLNPLPYIAETLLVETNSDNPSVSEGNTRFTVDIIKNATWSDGTPLTANDVAFTFTYAFESGKYGNPRSAALLGDLVAAYAPTTYRAIIEFNTQSIWHFYSFSTMQIIPKHIFNDVYGIGYDNWNRWNPVFNPTDPFVTSGPFNLTDFEVGEFFEFSANPDFCYYPEENTTSSTWPTNNGTSFNTSLAIAAGAVGAAVTILVGGILLFRKEMS